MFALHCRLADAYGLGDETARAAALLLLLLDDLLRDVHLRLPLDLSSRDRWLIARPVRFGYSPLGGNDHGPIVVERVLGIRRKLELVVLLEDGVGEVLVGLEMEAQSEALKVRDARWRSA